MDSDIIRYQAMIPVEELEVRTTTQEDMETGFFWELILMRSELLNRPEKVYQFMNR